MSRHISDHINGNHPSLSPSLQTQSQPRYSTQADVSCVLSLLSFFWNPYFEESQELWELQENKLGDTE